MSQEGRFGLLGRRTRALIREKEEEREREREFDEAYILHSSWIETREIEIERRGEEKR